MIPQKHIYLDNTYTFELTSAASVLNDGELVLADNPFHPQGGGQPADVGTVDGVAVTPLRLDGAAVGLRPAHPSPEWAEITARAVSGAEITARIDPVVRLKHAALHTAGHLIHGLLHTHKGLTLQQNNHFPSQARVVLAAPALDLAEVRAWLEVAMRQAINAQHEITTAQQDDIRTVCIQNIHCEQCAGTHLRHLGELAEVTIRSVSRKGGNLKIGYDASAA